MIRNIFNYWHYMHNYLTRKIFLWIVCLVWSCHFLHFLWQVFVGNSTFLRKWFNEEKLKLATILPQRKHPAGIFLFKVNNGDTRTVREICSKLMIKTPERRQWRPCSGVFIVNFEQVSHIVLVFPLLTLSK